MLRGWCQAKKYLATYSDFLLTFALDNDRAWSYNSDRTRTNNHWLWPNNHSWLRRWCDNHGWLRLDHNHPWRGRRGPCYDHTRGRGRCRLDHNHTRRRRGGRVHHNWPRGRLCMSYNYWAWLRVSATY